MYSTILMENYTFILLNIFCTDFTWTQISSTVVFYYDNQDDVPGFQFLSWVPQFHISCHSFKKLLEGFSWKRILRRFVKTTIDNWGESNTVVPDFTLSVHYSSCNYQFCWASFLLLTLSMYLFLRVPKAGWDARK